MSRREIESLRIEFQMGKKMQDWNEKQGLQWLEKTELISMVLINLLLVGSFHNCVSMNSMVTC